MRKIHLSVVFRICLIAKINVNVLAVCYEFPSWPLFVGDVLVGIIDVNSPTWRACTPDSQQGDSAADSFPLHNNPLHKRCRFSASFAKPVHLRQCPPCMIFGGCVEGFHPSSGMLKASSEQQLAAQEKSCEKERRNDTDWAKDCILLLLHRLINAHPR